MIPILVLISVLILSVVMSVHVVMVMIWEVMVRLVMVSLMTLLGNVINLINLVIENSSVKEEVYYYSVPGGVMG